MDLDEYAAVLKAWLAEWRAEHPDAGESWDYYGDG